MSKAGRCIHGITNIVMCYRGYVDLVTEHPDLEAQYRGQIEAYEATLARFAHTGRIKPEA